MESQYSRYQQSTPQEDGESGGDMERPQKPRHIKVHNLDVSKPVDINTPVDSLGGNNNLYFAMLSRLEGMSLSMCMQ